MTVRKDRAQEEAEAKLRAIRAYERRMQDIAWKHDVFLPALERFKEGSKKLNPKPPLELEPGE